MQYKTKQACKVAIRCTYTKTLASKHKAVKSHYFSLKDNKYIHGYSQVLVV